jgi:hypothetical protein
MDNVVDVGLLDSVAKYACRYHRFGGHTAIIRAQLKDKVRQ